MKAVFDAHVHIYPEFLKKERDRIAAREPWFELLTSSKVQKWGTAEELVAAMDEAGIAQSRATTFAFRDQGLCREMNDYVLEAAKRFPGRIVPLAVVSPLRPGAAEEAERAFDAVSYTHLGLKEAKEMVDGAPKTVKEAAAKEEACLLYTSRCV